MISKCNPDVPAALLWVALVHCYCVIVIGTLGNALALWCVATCTKTGRPMKVLVISVFLPVLVLCLAIMPVTGENWAAHLTCDPYRISMTVLIVTWVVTGILVLIELISIAITAVVRAVAIWAPHRNTLGIRGAVVLVVVTCIFATLTSLGLIAMVTMKQEGDPLLAVPITVLYFITRTLPALITAAAYIFMIVVIQRNKRRLVAYEQQERVTITMDQATRAMLAVFISNLVFCLPFSIYLLMSKQPFNSSTVFEVIHTTHFVVDPLAYIWFNGSYRKKTVSLLKKVMQSMPCSISQTGCNASRDQQEQ